MALLLFPIALLSSPPADPAAIRWSAPAACPQQDAVTKDIESTAGVSLDDVEGLDVDAEIVATEPGWTLTLRISTPSGSSERILQSPDCPELAETAATLVAVAVGASTVPEPEPPPEPPKTPEPEPEPQPQPKPKPAPEPQPTWRGTVGAGAGGGLGALPGLAGVVSLHAGAEARWVAIEAFSSVWLPRTRAIDGAEGTLFLWSVGARGCGLPSVGRVSFPICLGVEAGQLRGRGRGVPLAREGALPWVAARPEVAVRVPLAAHVGLRAGFALLAPLVRPGFVFDGIGTLHRVGPVAGMLGAGVDVHFP